MLHHSSIYLEGVLMSWKVSAVLLSLMLLAVFSSASAQEGYYFVDKWGNEAQQTVSSEAPGH